MLETNDCTKQCARDDTDRMVILDIKPPMPETSTCAAQCARDDTDRMIIVCEQCPARMHSTCLDRLLCAEKKNARCPLCRDGVQMRALRHVMKSSRRARKRSKRHADQYGDSDNEDVGSPQRQEQQVTIAEVSPARETDYTFVVIFILCLVSEMVLLIILWAIFR